MWSARQIGRDAKDLWRFCLVAGSPAERRVALVADAILASGRADASAVLKQFLRLLKLDGARRTARVESASPLDRDVQAEVESSLSRRYGRGLATTFAVEPSLIGGMRLTIGSDVYDGSVRGALAALEARL